MPRVMKDKYDLLASVIDAIYDENQEVKVETINDGSGTKIPTKQGKVIYGSMSSNRVHAESIKIGKFSMRRLENGSYVIRTSNNEVILPREQDLELIWDAALRKYDIGNRFKGQKGPSLSNIKSVLLKYLTNSKLKDAANKEFTKGDNKSKFDKAKEKVKALGIQATDEQLKKRLAMIQGKSFEK